MKVFGNLCQEHFHSHLISHSQPQNKQFLHHLPLGPALWRSEFLASPESFCWSLISSNCKNSRHLCGTEAQELWNEHSRGMEHSNTAPKGIQLPVSEFQVKQKYFPHCFSDVLGLMCHHFPSAMWLIYGLAFILGEVVIRSEEQCPKWEMWQPRGIIVKRNSGLHWQASLLDLTQVSALTNIHPFPPHRDPYTTPRGRC